MGDHREAGNQEIWLPDVQPYNALAGFPDTLDYAMVKVDYKGKAFYSRPGMLEVMCKFSGLGAHLTPAPTPRAIQLAPPS